MGWWRNPTDTDQHIVVRDASNVATTIAVAAGAIGFVPDEFDGLVRGPGGSGLACAWEPCAAPEVKAEEPAHMPAKAEKKKG